MTEKTDEILEQAEFDEVLDSDLEGDKEAEVLESDSASGDKKANMPAREESSDKTPDGKPGKLASRKKSKLPFFIVGSLVLISLVAGLIYWLNARRFETTDDAFIEADIVRISPTVSAYVTKVYVDSNQRVKKGQLLVELDASDYEVRLEKARAQLQTAFAHQNQALAQVKLTRSTSNASITEATSGVESARSGVNKMKAGADAKKSQISQAKSSVKTASASLAEVSAQVPLAKSNLELAQKEFNRINNLYRQGDVSKQAYDQAINVLQKAQLSVAAAEKQVAAARSRVAEAKSNVSTAENNYRESVAEIDTAASQVGSSIGHLQDANAAPDRIAVQETQAEGAGAEIAQAQAAVQQAEIDLNHTKIYAPEDGIVTKKSVLVGQLVQPGTPLMALSQSDVVWVVANFKETQLKDMRVGQKVDIEVDAYPDKKFRGTVQSFQSGTGSAFSLLPAENATGNYIKVVQRVPVKIVFDEKPDSSHLLAPGMSVEPAVRVR
ncbi:MAG: HlyD family secretion protein [Pyrinomonadaceae bacterium]